MTLDPAGIRKSYFAFDGRLSRIQFWRRWLRLQLVFAPLWCAGLFAILAFGKWGGVVLAVGLPAYLPSTTSCVVRRLHDRSKTGWWLMAIAFGPIFGAGLADRLMHSRGVGFVWTGLALWVGVLAFDVWAWVEVGFRRGPADHNLFGPAPDPTPASA